MQYLRTKIDPEATPAYMGKPRPRETLKLARSVPDRLPQGVTKKGRHRFWDTPAQREGLIGSNLIQMCCTWTISRREGTGTAAGLKDFPGTQYKIIQGDEELKMRSLVDQSIASQYKGIYLSNRTSHHAGVRQVPYQISSLSAPLVKEGKLEPYGTHHAMGKETVIWYRLRSDLPLQGS